jgi:hypothetical protein
LIDPRVEYLTTVPPFDYEVPGFDEPQEYVTLLSEFSESFFLFVSRSFVTNNPFLDLPENPRLSDRVHPLREPLEDALPGSEEAVAEDLLPSDGDDEDNEDGGDFEFPVFRLPTQPSAPLNPPVPTIIDLDNSDDDDESYEDDSDDDVEISSVRPATSRTDTTKPPTVIKEAPLPIPSITTRSQSKKRVESTTPRDSFKAPAPKLVSKTLKNNPFPTHNVKLMDPVDTPSTTDKGSRGRSSTVKGNAKGKGRAKAPSDFSPPPVISPSKLANLARLRTGSSNLEASRVHSLREDLDNLRPVSLYYICSLFIMSNISLGR